MALLEVMPYDYYSRSQEHGKLVLRMIEADIRKSKQPKPKRPKPQTPYKGSWAESMKNQG
jgi:hypothetical protein